MRENTARKVLSGWSAFRLGLTRPELTVLSVGEFDLAGGQSEWGIVIQDLRTGHQHLIVDEREWERIKKQGLPSPGSSIGVTQVGGVGSTQSTELEEGDEQEDDAEDRREALRANPESSTHSTAPVLASAEDFQLAIAEQAMTFVRRLRAKLDLPLEAGYAAASETSLLYLVATMQQVRELDPTLEWYVEEATGGVTGALMASFGSEWNQDDHEDYIDDEDGDEEEDDIRNELEQAMDIDTMDARIDDLSARFTKRLADYSDYRVKMPIDRHSSLARQFALRIRTEVGGSSTAEDATLEVISTLADINPRGHLQALFRR